VDDPKLSVVVARSEKFDGRDVVERRNRARARRGGIEGEDDRQAEAEIHVITPV